MHESLVVSKSSTTWESFQADGLKQVAEAVERSTGVSADRIMGHNIAKAIAFTPFLSGCSQPARVAVSHLLQLVQSWKAPDIFHHTPTDDTNTMNRFATMMYPNGDRQVQERLRHLLALNMVNDYVRDAEADARIGKYNPVVSGEWDADALMLELSEWLDKHPNPELDKVAGPDVVQAGWGG